MNQRDRKPRWWLRILSVVLVLAALVGAAELVLRAILPQTVAASMRSIFGLSADHPVDVHLGGSALLHAITGEIGDVSVAIDDAELVEHLRGDLRLHADHLPFNVAGGYISGAAATFTVNRGDLPAAVSLLTGGIAQHGEVSDGQLVVSRDVSVFGVSVPVSVSLGLATEHGDVLVDPISMSAAGFDLTAEQLSSLVQITAQTVCVKDRLPAGITLTGIDLSSTGSVSISADVAPDIASNSAQQEPGSC